MERDLAGPNEYRASLLDVVHGEHLPQEVEVDLGRHARTMPLDGGIEGFLGHPDFLFEWTRTILDHPRPSFNPNVGRRGRVVPPRRRENTWRTQPSRSCWWPWAVTPSCRGESGGSSRITSATPMPSPR